MAALSERGEKMITIISVLISLSLICVILRIFARIKRRIGFGMDDYLCFVATIALISMLIELVLWCTIGGNGEHIGDLSNHTLVLFSQIFIANQFSYFLLCPTLKISIICFYRRVFSVPMFQKITMGLNCLIAAWGTGIFLACALQCRPLNAFWDRSIDGHCFNLNTFIIVNQAFNVVMDFVILFLPIPMIWRLHMSTRDKIALNGVFALGGFVCFASIYRIVTLFYISSSDESYTVYQATLWTHIEPSVGLICACLPTIRGLFPAGKLSRNTNGPSDYINSNGWSGSKSGNFVDTPKKAAFERRDHELDPIIRDDIDSERSLVAMVSAVAPGSTR
uniref:Heme A synthase n=1 Tax=Talaromyces marneffei PM1 TaxID=1077442 RepID=A0A093XTU6_TALMA